MGIFYVYSFKKFLIHKTKYLIIGLATVSGYSIGYYLGLKNLPSCNNKKFRNYLEDTSNWIKLERQYLNKLIYNDSLVLNKLELTSKLSLNFLDSLDTNSSKVLTNYQSLRDSILGKDTIKANKNKYSFFFIEIDSEELNSDGRKEKIFKLGYKFGSYKLDFMYNEMSDSSNIKNTIEELKNNQINCFRLYEKLANKNYNVKNSDFLLLFKREVFFVKSNSYGSIYESNIQIPFEKSFDILYQID